MDLTSWSPLIRFETIPCDPDPMPVKVSAPPEMTEPRFGADPIEKPPPRAICARDPWACDERSPVIASSVFLVMVRMSRSACRMACVFVAISCALARFAASLTGTWPRADADDSATTTMLRTIGFMGGSFIELGFARRGPQRSGR